MKRPDPRPPAAVASGARKRRARTAASRSAPAAGAEPAVPLRPSGRGRERRGDGWLYGRHAVAAALANPQRLWRLLAVLAGQEGEAAALIAAAQATHSGAEEKLRVMDRASLDRLLPEGAVHQGWALDVEPLEPVDLDDALRAASLCSGRAVIVVLDQVSDPHNAGAVLRSAAAFGAAAVVLAGHAAPPAGGALAKVASGALDLVTLVRAGNPAQTLDRLKAAGYWCVGLDEAAPAALASLDPGPRVALVLGSEGGGLRRLVRERVDYLARLPTRPGLPSLNLSNAAAVALYELLCDKAG